MRLLFITLIILLSSLLASAQSKGKLIKNMQGIPGADTNTVIKELVILLDRDYVSGTIYFLGAGFPQVRQVTFSGDPYASTKPFWNMVGPGSRIAFDNCIYLDDQKQKKVISKMLTLP